MEIGHIGNELIEEPSFNENNDNNIYEEYEESEDYS